MIAKDHKGEDTQGHIGVVSFFFVVVAVSTLIFGIFSLLYAYILHTQSVKEKV